MPNFYVNIVIESGTQEQMFTDITWLRDNHGSKVQLANANPDLFSITATMLDTTLEDAISTIESCQTQFSSRLSSWYLSMSVA